MKHSHLKDCSINKDGGECNCGFISIGLARLNINHPCIQTCTMLTKIPSDDSLIAEASSIYNDDGRYFAFLEGARFMKNKIIGEVK